MESHIKKLNGKNLDEIINEQDNKVMDVNTKSTPNLTATADK